jgi:hypothetical protein
MDNARNQGATLRRLARKAAEAEAGAVQPVVPDPAGMGVPAQRWAGDDRDPWLPILQSVANDSARWALALAHAHESTGIVPQELHSLSSEAMEAFAAVTHAWLEANPATRTIRPW